MTFHSSNDKPPSRNLAFAREVIENPEDEPPPGGSRFYPAKRYFSNQAIKVDSIYSKYNTILRNNRGINEKSSMGLEKEIYKNAWRTQ